jgi:hypothetical protein
MLARVLWAILDDPSLEAQRQRRLAKTLQDMKARGLIK